MERPVGIAKFFAGEQDEIGLCGANDLIGLCGFSDHAYGTGWNVGFAVNGFGVMDLIAGAHGNLLGGMIAAAGDIDEIDASLLHESGERDGLREIPGWGEGFGSPVGCGDPDE